MFHEKMICNVKKLEYDFNLKRGFLWLEEGDCCNMPPCVAMFMAIDPDVKVILTFSGDHTDTMYEKRHGEWKAFDTRPRKAA